MMKLTLAVGLLAVAASVGCDSESRARTAPAAATTQVPADEAKITNAMSAAPDAIARNAAVVDWPQTEGGEMRELRAGTNGWVCHPSTPPSTGAAGEDPMCLDTEFQKWVAALMSRTEPQVAAVGIAYMLQGDRGASNVDPFASGPTADNQWVQTPAHIMVLVPDEQDLEAFPTDPSAGAPYVMWKGTPYAHIMVPVGE